ncbi:hypothetical protein HanRHA438_Chr05g0246281 [Helianthus annuus]|nr:hypothetical protein HanRHA438_Chr05g0246281 [Helianthus annuus]
MSHNNQHQHNNNAHIIPDDRHRTENEIIPRILRCMDVNPDHIYTTCFHFVEVPCIGKGCR